MLKFLDKKIITILRSLFYLDDNDNLTYMGVDLRKARLLNASSKGAETDHRILAV